MITVSDAEIIQEVILITPVLLDFDEEFQMAAMPQQALYVMACACADLFQTLCAMTDDDLLLRSPLDENDAVDAREIVSLLFKPFGDDRHHVRNLFARRRQNLLAHDLRE